MSRLHLTLAATPQETPVAAHVAPARPIATYYYDTMSCRVDQWSAIGRAATIEGGIRAAFKRILAGQASRALVHGEFGEVVARLNRTPKGITLLYVPSTQGVH